MFCGKKLRVLVVSLVIFVASGALIHAQDSTPTPTPAPANSKVTETAKESKDKTADTDAAADAKTQQAKDDNDGTDPTKPSNTSASFTSEYVSVRGGFYTNTMVFTYGQTISKDGKTSISIKVPFANTNVLNDNTIGIGDIGVKLTRVMKRTRTYGIVVGGEMNFATAARTELGTGKYVFKGNFTYAKFLKGGHIFAPTIVQSNSLFGKDNRATVNVTVLDFYFVPKLKDPKTFVTIDPAISLDWENKKEFASLAVTVGRRIGKVFGGQGQIFVKPSVFAGGERPANWGIQFGFKVLGF